jgi:hypothetical protein
LSSAKIACKRDQKPLPSLAREKQEMLLLLVFKVKADQVVVKLRGEAAGAEEESQPFHTSCV